MESDIPHSIETAREYLKTINPGNIFRIFSPVSQVLGLLALLLFWKSSHCIPLYLGIAFDLYVLGDAMTFAYFYPRDDIMFKTASLTDVENLRKTSSEWNLTNWLRSLIILAGIFFSFLPLHKIYTLKLNK